MKFVCEFIGRTKAISLGQNQGEQATKLIVEAAAQGNWIILENCHLAASWMEGLETLYNNTMQSDVAHEDFRLWCITEPMPTFPITMLRNGIKVVDNHAKGITEIMLRQFSTEPLISDKYFSNAFAGQALVQWLRSVFAMVAFHAVVEERKLFGPIGWNVPYTFGDVTLKQSIGQIRLLLKQTAFVSFDGLFYLAGECNYGGNTVDELDRRLLLSLLERFCNDSVIQTDNYKFFDEGNIEIPSEANRINSIHYLASLESSLSARNLGLHETSNFHKNANECNQVRPQHNKLLL